MSVTLEWTISLASILALVVSVVTLYLAHLRGPHIELAIPGKQFPCQGLREVNGAALYTLVARFLIVNSGNRPGIIFAFRLDPGDSSVGYYRLDPSPDSKLPLAIKPGIGWQVSADIQVRVDEDSLDHLLKLRRGLPMKAVYLASSGLFGKREKKTTIFIDLRPLLKTLGRLS